jgi:hypothetical protein
MNKIFKKEKVSPHQVEMNEKQQELMNMYKQKEFEFFKTSTILYNRLGAGSFPLSGCKPSDFPDLDTTRVGLPLQINCERVAERLILENKIDLFHKFMRLLSFNEHPSPWDKY